MVKGESIIVWPQPPRGLEEVKYLLTVRTVGKSLVLQLDGNDLAALGRAIKNAKELKSTSVISGA